MALSIKKVGVIGAGQMGSGIAHVCALAGFDVKLNDIDTDRIKAGIATINGNMARQVRKKTISEDDRQGALKHSPNARAGARLQRMQPHPDEVGIGQLTERRHHVDIMLSRRAPSNAEEHVVLTI